jgi:maleylpyruvate isomerase
MYASMEKRDADIEEWSALPADELIARYAGSAAELDAAMDALDDRQWSAEVVTRLGIPIPATLIPWLRAREVMIHAVDLNAGIDFDELPSEFLMALCADIAASRGANPGPAVRLTVIASDQPDRGGLADLPGLSWAIAGDGDAAEVTGTLGAIAAYLAGRGSDGLTRVGGGVVPALPAWL